MDPRVTELHCIMPIANIGSVMTQDSQRQRPSDAKRAAPPRQWARAMNVVIAPMIDNIGRLSVLSRIRAVFRGTVLPKLNSGAFRMKDAEDRIEESP